MYLGFFFFKQKKKRFISALKLDFSFLHHISAVVGHEIILKLHVREETIDYRYFVKNE